MLLHEVKLQQKQESVRMPRQAFNNIKGISITGVQHETVTAPSGLEVHHTPSKYNPNKPCRFGLKVPSMAT